MTVTTPQSPIDVANTVLQEAFRAGLLLTPKLLFAAVMEISRRNPRIFQEGQSIVNDPRRGIAPSSLMDKFVTVPVGAVKQYIPDAGGNHYVIRELEVDSRRALGL